MLACWSVSQIVYVHSANERFELPMKDFELPMKKVPQIVYILPMRVKYFELSFELSMKDFDLQMKYECQWKFSSLFANEMLSIANDTF